MKLTSCSTLRRSRLSSSTNRSARALRQARISARASGLDSPRSAEGTGGRAGSGEA